jgi:hypothetical protein
MSRRIFARPADVSPGKWMECEGAGDPKGTGHPAEESAPSPASIRLGCPEMMLPRLFCMT